MNGELLALAMLATVIATTLSVLAELHGGQDDVR